MWGNSHLREVWAANVVGGFWDDNIVWGNITRATEDNIVWGDNADNIGATWRQPHRWATRQHRLGLQSIARRGNRRIAVLG